MPPQRTLEIWQSKPDFDELRKWTSHLVTARCVTDKDGETTFNTIWQSKHLAPLNKFEWDEPAQYALSWTLQRPETGTDIRVNAEWEPVSSGDVLDIHEAGHLQKSAEGGGGTDGWFTIGTNKFRADNGYGVHIVIGRLDSGGFYHPIWVDLKPIGRNMGAKYQPQEKLQWWYQQGDVSTGTVITQVSGISTSEGDFSVPHPTTGKHYLSSTYAFRKGQWINSHAPPLAKLPNGHFPEAAEEPVQIRDSEEQEEGFEENAITRPHRAPEFLSWPVKYVISPTPDENPDMLSRLSDYLSHVLNDKYQNVYLNLERYGKPRMMLSLGPPKVITREEEREGVWSNEIEKSLAKILNRACMEGYLNRAEIMT